MSDLSKLLEDVYRSGPSTPAAPSWSSDSALDEVFSDWVPGESEGASAAEQAFAQVMEPAPLPLPTETADELDALVQAAAAMAPTLDDDIDSPQEFERQEFEAPEFEAPVAESTPVIEDRDAFVRWTPERDLPDATVPVAPLVSVAPWSRQDDDILPNRGLTGRRRRFALRRK
jgi:hypothetical protein